MKNREEDSALSKEVSLALMHVNKKYDSLIAQFDKRMKKAESEGRSPKGVSFREMGVRDLLRVALGRIEYLLGDIRQEHDKPWEGIPSSIVELLFALQLLTEDKDEVRISENRQELNNQKQ